MWCATAEWPTSCWAVWDRSPREAARLSCSRSDDQHVLKLVYMDNSDVHAWLWLPGVLGALLSRPGPGQVQTGPGQCGPVWLQTPELPAPAGYPAGHHRLGQRLPEKADPNSEPKPQHLQRTSVSGSGKQDFITQAFILVHKWTEQRTLKCQKSLNKHVKNCSCLDFSLIWTLNAAVCLLKTSLMMRTLWTAALCPLSSTTTSSKVDEIQTLSSSCFSVWLTKHVFLVNGDQVKFDEEEDEEQLYELASAANGEPSDFSSDDKGVHPEEQLEKSEWDEQEASSCLSEFHYQQDVIENIRCVIYLTLSFRSLTVVQSALTFYFLDKIWVHSLDDKWQHTEA